MKMGFSISRVCSHLILIAMSLVVALPLLWTLRNSFATKVVTYHIPPDLFFSPTLANYRLIFSQMNFGSYFLNSIIVALATTIISVLLGSLAAYAIDRYKAGGRATPLIILSTQMMPPVILVIPFFLIFSTLRLDNTYPGLVICYVSFNLPYVVWLMMSFFKGVSRELDEAAFVEGAGPLRVFTKIVMPAALPGVGAAAALSFVLCWNEFLLALVLSGDTTRTLPVAISSLVTQQGTAIGAVCAATILSIAPIIVIFFIVRNFIFKRTGIHA